MNNKLTRRVAAAAACLAVVVAAPANADPITSNAENIRKLNIMLMVTSLRCRNGEDDFQAEYKRFTNVHLTNLNRAGAHLRSDLNARLGKRGSKRALDRIGVSIANSYGDGHPWLNCAELKDATHDLSERTDAQHLASAAGELLSIQPNTRWAAN